MSGDGSTRERVWLDICARISDPHERMAAWVRTPVVEMTPDDEWAAAHAGRCVYCGEAAQMYPSGWRCPERVPGGAR